MARFEELFVVEWNTTGNGYRWHIETVAKMLESNRRHALGKSEGDVWIPVAFCDTMAEAIETLRKIEKAQTVAGEGLGNERAQT